MPEKPTRALIQSLLSDLFPICRSLTGDGVRATLRRLSKHVPLDVMEIPSGTRVFDWVVPWEWNIRDAHVKGPSGRKVIDFKKSNLHVVGYSVPIQKTMSLEQLQSKLHSLPDQPSAIPYVTSYYAKDWGFCLSHQERKKLRKGLYRVWIDSRLAPGSMTIGESVLRGDSDREILFSTYCCHPSMANNELSGPIVTLLMYRYLAGLPRRHFTYRFYFGPEPIGALAYLSRRGAHLKKKMDAGFVVTCCGDRAPFTYKKVRRPDNVLDRAVLHVLKHRGKPFRVLDFFPTGSDDRQYASPGFNLPVGTLMRSMYGTYPEYHTSLDDCRFVTPESLYESALVYSRVVDALESDREYLNLKPYGEPRLGKYGLYASLGASRVQSRRGRALRYVLNWSDGEHGLIEIAEKLGVPVWDLQPAVQDLIRAKLLRRIR